MSLHVLTPARLAKAVTRLGTPRLYTPLVRVFADTYTAEVFRGARRAFFEAASASMSGRSLMDQRFADVGKDFGEFRPLIPPGTRNGASNYALAGGALTIARRLRGDRIIRYVGIPRAIRNPARPSTAHPGGLPVWLLTHWALNGYTQYMRTSWKSFVYWLTAADGRGGAYTKRGSKHFVRQGYTGRAVKMTSRQGPQLMRALRLLHGAACPRIHGTITAVFTKFMNAIAANRSMSQFQGRATWGNL